MNTLERIRAKLEEHNIEGLIVDSPFNRSYLTGFTGTFGLVLITLTEAIFITDFRYTEQAKKQANNYKVIENRNVLKEAGHQIKLMNLTTLGFEEEHVSFKKYNQIRKEINNVELVPVSGIIEDLRKIKTAEEIDSIKTAALIGDNAFKKILEVIRPGISEIDIKNQLEIFMRDEGAISSSFDMIIASGYRSAMPHGVASDKVVENGDMVTLDFGALYNNYCSDMTRTVAVGEPNTQLKEIYTIVKDSLQLGIDETKSGVQCKQVDKVVRDYIASKGYGEDFGHGAGHSLGLEIHESPFFSQKSNEILDTGMVMTIEPGIYITDLGGVRIEDDVLVTENGCEILTNSPKELIIL